MERVKRNPSDVDIPHSARVIRGIDAERAEAKGALSFDEMRSHVGVRKGKNRRSARVWTALGRSASGYSKKLETLANSLAWARLRERLI